MLLLTFSSCQEQGPAVHRPKRQFLAGVLVGAALRRPAVVSYNTYPQYSSGYSGYAPAYNHYGYNYYG